MHEYGKTSILGDGSPFHIPRGRSVPLAKVRARKIAALTAASSLLFDVAPLGHHENSQYHATRRSLVLVAANCSSNASALSKSFVPAPSTTLAMTGARTAAASCSRHSAVVVPS
jgi:hypothetical protein